MNWKYHRQLTLPLLDSRLAECITSGRTLTSMVSIDGISVMSYDQLQRTLLISGIERSKTINFLIRLITSTNFLITR